ncbi:MAG: hypothetical protein ACP5U2_08365, partial [Bryobacteraceae bacterium]
TAPSPSSALEQTVRAPGLASCSRATGRDPANGSGRPEPAKDPSHRFSLAPADDPGPLAQARNPTGLIGQCNESGGQAPDRAQGGDEAAAGPARRNARNSEALAREDQLGLQQAAQHAAPVATGAGSKLEGPAARGETAQAARARPNEVEARQPVGAPSRREISLRIEAATPAGRAKGPVAVHLVERAGRIEVRVRSADPQLRQSLQREAPALVERLESEGFRARVLPLVAESAPAGPSWSRPWPSQPAFWAEADAGRGGAGQQSWRQRDRRHDPRAGQQEDGAQQILSFRRLHDGFLD